jgi:hypothetical protein
MCCTVFPACDCVGYCQFGPTRNGVTAVTTAPRPKSPKHWTPSMLHGQPCEYCGVTMDVTNPWRHPTRDHIVPRSKGGTDKQENIAKTCRGCNEGKGSENIRDWYQWLVDNQDPRAERVGRFMAKLPKELL